MFDFSALSFIPLIDKKATAYQILMRNNDLSSALTVTDMKHIPELGPGKYQAFTLPNV